MATIVQERQGLLALQFPDDDGPQEAVQGRLGQWSDELTRLKLEAIRAARRAAIALTEWHKAETRRVYAMLDSYEEDNEQEELLRWIRKRGGVVVPWELSAHIQKFRGNTEAAKAALMQLAAAGFGTIETETTPQRGRLRSVFKLAPQFNR